MRFLGELPRAFVVALLSTPGSTVADGFGKHIIFRLKTEKHRDGREHLVLRGRDLHAEVEFERQAAKYPNAPFARQYNLRARA